VQTTLCFIGIGGLEGFSVRNLKYMKKFSGLFSEDDIDQMGFAGLTWYHHMALVDKTAAGQTERACNSNYEGSVYL